MKIGPKGVKGRQAVRIAKKTGAIYGLGVRLEAAKKKRTLFVSAINANTRYRTIEKRRELVDTYAGSTLLGAASYSLLDDEQLNVASRLRHLGIEPGAKLSNAKVRALLGAFRASAEHITGSYEVAKAIMANTDFDGTGQTPEQLIREGRAGRVLSRLDDLRFGPRG